MRIVVCVKYVPDVQSHRRIESGTVVRGEEDSINDVDENAIEAAISAKENHGGEVIALSMGPAGAQGSVRRALQMGADRAIMVTDDALAGSDVIKTARVLAQAIEKISSEGEAVDLVLCGVASLDGMTSMLPTALATVLEWPCLGGASTFGIEEDGVTVSKFNDGFQDILSAPFPLVASVNDEVNQPRYPGFKQMMAAKKKQIETWDLANLPQGQQLADGDCAFTQVLEAHERPPRQSEHNIITDSGEAGKVLAQFLKDNGFAAGQEHINE
ncbi:MAG: electron transfer flavoprotein subunit beta/FixA family protein [Actinomycetaceae bacterium]|nr:electron transfer flavoprotein subunit beta/FixA family protein [Actinomycetaceae bacterium]